MDGMLGAGFQPCSPVSGALPSLSSCITQSLERGNMDKMAYDVPGLWALSLAAAPQAFAHGKDVGMSANGAASS